MEVVTIEKRTFSYVCESFTEFAKRIESLCSSHTQKVENWLDSQEVCLLLGLSKRTLQYRQFLSNNCSCVDYTIQVKVFRYTLPHPYIYQV